MFMCNFRSIFFFRSIFSFIEGENNLNKDTHNSNGPGTESLKKRRNREMANLGGMFFSSDMIGGSRTRSKRNNK